MLKAICKISTGSYRPPGRFAILQVCNQLPGKGNRGSEKISQRYLVRNFCQTNLYQTESLKHVSSFYDRYVFPEPPSMISEDEHERVINKVNNIIQDPGRLFAVITVGGHQYKVTAGDIIRITGLIQAECGEQLRLEKVSLVGGRDFTLLGKPVLPRKVVKVLATVIEKTPGEDIVVKKFIRRRRHENTYRVNALYTILRINNIDVINNLE